MGRPQVTGVGSLPHRDIVVALALVENHCQEFPFLPQLPNLNLNEFLLTQPFAGGERFFKQYSSTKLQLEKAQTSAFIEWLASATVEPLSSYSAAATFLERYNSKPVSKIKLQWTGPVTILSLLKVEEESAWTIPELKAAVLARLERQIRDLAQSLLLIAPEIYLVLDEPMLYLASMDSAARLGLLQRFAALTREAGIGVGVHCCGPLDFSEFFSLDVDVFSFPWTVTDLAGLSACETFKQRVAGGSIFALGLDSITLAQQEQTAEALRAFCDALSLPFQQLVLTTDCGLALAAEVEAERDFANLDSLASRL